MGLKKQFFVAILFIPRLVARDLDATLRQSSGACRAAPAIGRAVRLVSCTDEGGLLGTDGVAVGVDRTSAASQRNVWDTLVVNVDSAAVVGLHSGHSAFVHERRNIGVIIKHALARHLFVVPNIFSVD